MSGHRIGNEAENEGQEDGKGDGSIVVPRSGVAATKTVDPLLRTPYNLFSERVSGFVSHLGHPTLDTFGDGLPSQANRSAFTVSPGAEIYA